MPEEKPKKDILGYEEEDERAEERELIEKRKAFNPAPAIYLTLLVFLLALAVRLVFLFVFTETDKPMIGDVWHHWQIAYLSKEVGFKEGFLRLWDFKGMEYYWGLLHPLVLIAGFIVSGSVSIVVPRMISTLFGSLVITLIFLIVARYFNKKAAFASALFLILLPTTVFHDTLGLQEPLGLFFLLLGIYLWPVHAFVAGFSWMLAGMVRAEYWLFGAGLLLAVLIREKSFDRKIAALFGYGIPGILYLKYMLDYTGNPIYPIYWNFLVLVIGEWSPKTGGLTSKLELIKSACQILGSSLLISGLIVLWKKFKSYLFLLLGLANLVFAFFILGFGAYLYGFVKVASYPGFIDKIWIGKLFAFPWGFLGILAAILLLHLLPKKIGKLGTLLGTLVFLVVLGTTQLIWPSINQHYLQAEAAIEPNKRVVQKAANAAEAIANEYAGEGTIFIPAQSEMLTYFLAYNEGVSGEKLITTFYDPFYYYKGEDPFFEWDIFREEIIEWLQKHDAELFVTSEHEIGIGRGGLRDYARMLELEEGKLFELTAKEGMYRIYKVKISGN